MVPHALHPDARGPLILLLLACAEPLPEDAEGLFHALWQAWDEDPTADHERLGEVALALAELQPGRGELSSLSSQELAAFGEHEEQVGVSLINPLDCSLEPVEEVVIHLDQDLLFPDVFETYERAYTGDEAAWRQDRQPLAWQADYVVSIPLTSDLSCTLLGEIREPEPGVLVARSILAEPALSAEDDGVFDQVAATDHRALQPCVEQVLLPVAAQLLGLRRAA